VTPAHEARTIHVVSCHAEGDVGDVIGGGVDELLIFRRAWSASEVAAFSVPSG